MERSISEPKLLNKKKKSHRKTPVTKIGVNVDGEMRQEKTNTHKPLSYTGEPLNVNQRWNSTLPVTNKKITKCLLIWWKSLKDPCVVLCESPSSEIKKSALRAHHPWTKSLITNKPIPPSFYRFAISATSNLFFGWIYIKMDQKTVETCSLKKIK